MSELKHEDCIKLLHLKNNNDFFIFVDFWIFVIKWIYKGYKPLTWKYRHAGNDQIKQTPIISEWFVKIVNLVVDGYSIDFFK